jgi:hypothetical protein
MKTTKMTCWLAGLLLTCLAHAAELPSAPEVLKETGVSGGLAVVVGTTDGKLEADLTRGGADKAAWVQVQAVAEFIGGVDKDGKPRTWNSPRIADQEPAAAGRMLVHGPACNGVSRDRLVAPPNTMHWLARFALREWFE